MAGLNKLSNTERSVLVDTETAQEETKLAVGGSDLEMMVDLLEGILCELKLQTELIKGLF